MGDRELIERARRVPEDWPNGQMIRALADRLEAPSSLLEREGWVLVPREPTEAMVRMGTAANSYDSLPPPDAPGDDDYADDFRRSYAAMLRAAPKP